MFDVHVNFLAVFVAALATFALGALWYSPALFGKAWVRANGYTPEQLASLRKHAGRAYGVSFVCYLIMGTVLSTLFSFTGASGAARGATLGALIWLGFVLTVGLTGQVFSGRTRAAFAIDAAYQLAYLALMGVILGVWP
jgi:Protein of unknown function (DUF1761)